MDDLNKEQNLGYPFTYYSDEILTVEEAKSNRRFGLVYVKYKLLLIIYFSKLFYELVFQHQQIEEFKSHQFEFTATQSKIILKLDYHPYLSVYNEPSSIKILMPNSRFITNDEGIRINPSFSQEAINSIRSGGDGNPIFNQAMWLFLTIWMLRYQSSAFQNPPIHQIYPPHLQPFEQFIKPDNNFRQESSLFDCVVNSNLEANELTKDEALNLIIERCGTLENPSFDFIDATYGFKTTDQTLLTKVHKAKSFNTVPELYGISKGEAVYLQKNGLVPYVQKYHKLPPVPYRNCLFENVKSFYNINKHTVNNYASYRGERVIIIHDYNIEKYINDVYLENGMEGHFNGRMLIFDAETLNLITPHDVNEKGFINYLKTGNVGSQKIPPAEGTLPPGNGKLRPGTLIPLPPKPDN